MAIQKEQKQDIVRNYRRSELDTGSSEVQVALLTARIKDLTEHFKVNKKDNHSRRGLIRLVNRRRKLLDYMKRTKPESYTKIIGELGIRK
ncbi:MAG: 30S ribosomal protein S15 [Bdellovibrionales bacterium]|nr:30S ribosomal protein S15 [Bdellovibrionales bacterium]